LTASHMMFQPVSKNFAMVK